MRDILFGNNNNQIVKKLSMKSFRQNIKQNKVMIVSIGMDVPLPIQTNQADANAIVSKPFAEKHSVYGVTTFISDGDTLGLGFMAFRNVFRDRKKVLLVFLSLFMGLTVFLSIFTLFSNPNWEYSAAVDAPYDFDLRNAVIKDGASCSLFNDNFLEKINSMHGITEQEIVYGIGAQLSLSDTA